MNYLIAGAACSMLLSGVASAVEVKETGAYVGGAIGSTVVDSDTISFIKFLPDNTVDETDSGFQLWGGYKFRRWFAVEGRYASLGEYSASGKSFGNLRTFNADVSALTANAVFIAPFGRSGWDFYGTVGLGVAFSEIKTNIGFNSDDQDPVFTLGLGFRWTPTPPLTVSVGLDGWGTEVNDGTGNESLVVGMSHIGVQYNF